MTNLNKQFIQGLLVTSLFISGCSSALAQQKGNYNVAIFLYQNIELLDFAGPTEVFAATQGFKVYTVSVDGKDILSQGMLTVRPEYAIENAPVPDIIVFPGGNAGPSSRDTKVIEWAKGRLAGGSTLMSVCTGAFILGRAGMLDDLNVTTHFGSINSLQELVPTSKVLEHTRFVDNGNIITTAGVSAGIDGALHLVARIKGVEVAKATAHYMEYDKWNPEDGKVIFQNPYLQVLSRPDAHSPIPYEGELTDYARKLQMEGQYQSSAEILERGVKWYPDAGAMYNLLSLAYAKTGKASPINERDFLLIIDSGNPDEAIKVYDKAMKDFPGWKIFTENAINEKGYELVGKEKYESAVKVLELNTRAYPNSANTWDSLAEAYMLSGNKTDAIKNYRKSLELNPGNTNAKQMLIKLEEMK